MSTSDNLTGRRERLSAAKQALLRKRLQGKQTSDLDETIGAEPLTGPAPLSYTQQRVWFLQQLFPESTAYNMPEAWRIGGPLNVAALQTAVNQVVRQQAALRTSFLTRDGEVMQQVVDGVTVQIPVTDISHLAPDAREVWLHELASAASNHRFDLGVAPLLWIEVIRLDETSFVLLVTMHHIISDEWSIDIFWRELHNAYAMALEGRPGELSPLPIQYTDYARWQRAQVAAGAFDEQAAYWTRQLAGELAPLQLPSDHPRPATQSFRGDLLERKLPADLMEAIQALSRQTGATPYMVLLAAFQVLLSRYSDQRDIAVGTPIANRQRPETKDVMGMFINTAVIRSDLGDNPSFLELLDSVRQTVLAALANQDLPFDLLVRAKQPERDLSYNPLFQTMFVYQSREGTRTLPGLRLERMMIRRGVAKFDLTLLAGEEEGRLRTLLEYNSDLFTRETAERILTHWQTLLQGIVAKPDAPVASRPILGEAERQILIHDWNAGQTPLPETACMHTLIEEAAARTPQAPAVIAGDRSLTYAELNAAADGLARQLVARGVGPGTLVGLYVERSPEMIVGILGVLKAGGAYVPLEPSYPAERVAYVLRDTQTPLIVAQTHLADRLPAGDGQVILLDAVSTSGPGSGPEVETAWEAAVGPDDPAYVIYTSGSTGQPKGVVVSHRNLVASTLVRREIYRDPVERYLLLSSFAFDSSVAGIFWTLVDGGALVLPAPDEEKDVRQLAAIIAERKVTHTLALPALYRLLLTYAPEPALASLQTVIVAGEACPPDLGPLHHARLPGAGLYNEYGPTEATVWCTVYPIPAADDGGPVPIGRPIPNYQIYILDPAQQPTPIGVAGELYVAGAGVTRGYWNNAERTAERFVTLTLEGGPTGVRAYRTGDLARWRGDGQIEFLGRVDDQIKLNGFRIEPGEIEATLLRHEGIVDAAVVLHEDAENGAPAGRRLIAYVAHEVDGTAADPAALQDFLRSTLPDNLVPQQIVSLAALPRTPNGKLDRNALPVPGPAGSVRQRSIVAPRTPAERTLARIWADLLRLPAVSVHDKFFELGGDSLLSIQVIARAQQEGLGLTPRQLFREQTIARLAAVADTRSGPVRQAAPASGPVPLTPIQHWFFEQGLSKPAHWNRAIWLETSETLDRAKLARALDAVVAQHGALRARFWEMDGRWQQEIVPEADPVEIEAISLAGLAPDDQLAQLGQIADDLHAAMDLTAAPLLRCAAVDLGGGTGQRVLLVLHHLIVDTVSWSVIAADLDRAYGQLVADESVTLPPVATSFADWAQSLVRLADGGALAKDARYWREAAIPAIRLPRTPADESINTEGASEVVTVALDRERTGQLLRDVHQAYHTKIEDLLLAALARAVGAWTGESSTLVTLERHGREAIDSELDLSRTVGWFTSLTPVAFALPDPNDPGAGLVAVKEQLRSLPHNGASYGILRYLGEDALRTELAGRPRPEILFNYLGQMTGAERQDVRLRPVMADIGQAYGPENARAHVIDINAWVSEERLTVNWQYAPALFEHGTMQQVAERYLAELAHLIDHCMEADRSRHTPSDFPMAALEQEDLDSLADLLEGLE